jgi:hypothetical protein
VSQVLNSVHEDNLIDANLLIEYLNGSIEAVQIGVSHDEPMDTDTPVVVDTGCNQFVCSSDWAERMASLGYTRDGNVIRNVAGDVVPEEEVIIQIANIEVVPPTAVIRGVDSQGEYEVIDGVVIRPDVHRVANVAISYRSRWADVCDNDGHETGRDGDIEEDSDSDCPYHLTDASDVEMPQKKENIANVAKTTKRYNERYWQIVKKEREDSRKESKCFLKDVPIPFVVTLCCLCYVRDILLLLRHLNVTGICKMIRAIRVRVFFNVSVSSSLMTIIITNICPTRSITDSNVSNTMNVRSNHHTIDNFVFALTINTSDHCGRRNNFDVSDLNYDLFFWNNVTGHISNHISISSITKTCHAFCPIT